MEHNLHSPLCMWEWGRERILKVSFPLSSSSPNCKFAPRVTWRLQGENISAGLVVQLRAQDKGYKDFEHIKPQHNSFFHKLIRASYIEDGKEHTLSDVQIVPQAIIFILAGKDLITIMNSFLFRLIEDMRHGSCSASLVRSVQCKISGRESSSKMWLPKRPVNISVDQI